METLQERVNLLSKDFEKLNNFQRNIGENSTNQQRYEDCWNESSSLSIAKVNDNGLTHQSAILNIVPRSYLLNLLL